MIPRIRHAMMISRTEELLLEVPTITRRELARNFGVRYSTYYQMMKKKAPEVLERVVRAHGSGEHNRKIKLDDYPRILEMYTINNLTYREIGNICGVSRERVRQILNLQMKGLARAKALAKREADESRVRAVKTKCNLRKQAFRALVEECMLSKPKDFEALLNILHPKTPEVSRKALHGRFQRWCPDILRAVSKRPTAAQIEERKRKYREYKMADPHISTIEMSMKLGIKYSALIAWLGFNPNVKEGL